MSVHVVSLLYRWQTLAGAVLGGAFALLVAWYVARDARLRELRSAGMVVAGTLADIRAQYILTTRRAIEAFGDNADAVAQQIANDLLRFRPSLPPNFSAEIARLYLVHTHLAAHLAFATRVFSNVDQALTRWEKGHEPNAPAMVQAWGFANASADARVVKAGMEEIANHGGCAILMINRLVLSRLALWHRLRLWVRPGEIERQCKKALALGRFQNDLPEESPLQ